MPIDREALVIALREVVSISTEAHRKAALQKVADLISASCKDRWVGRYDVDHATATVMNIDTLSCGANTGTIISDFVEPTAVRCRGRK